MVPHLEFLERYHNDRKHESRAFTFKSTLEAKKLRKGQQTLQRSFRKLDKVVAVRAKYKEFGIVQVGNMIIVD